MVRHHVPLTNKNGKSFNDVGRENPVKIHGPTYENGYWRIKMNQEVYNEFKFQIL
jgi:hypothetical protein